MRPGDLDHLLLKLDAELCDDARYIDIRDQISDIIENEPTVPQDCSDCKRYVSPYFEVNFDKEQMKELVDKAKAEVLASIERPHGEWIGVKTSCDIGHKFYYCTKCGREIDIIDGESLEDYPFCHCGADMRKNVESST